MKNSGRLYFCLGGVRYGETDYNALLYDKMKASRTSLQGLAAFAAAGGNSESYLRVYDERGHCDVYGGTGAFSETGKGVAPIPLPA